MPNRRRDGPTWRHLVELYGQALTRHALVRLLILGAAVAALIAFGSRIPEPARPTQTATVERAIMRGADAEASPSSFVGRRWEREE